MPHTNTFLASLFELYRHHRTLVEIFLIVATTALAKFFYFGGTGRRLFADIIIVITVVSVISAHLTNIAISVNGLQITINHNDVALIIGLLGPHGVKTIASKLLKKKYGVEIPDYEFKDKK